MTATRRFLPIVDVAGLFAGGVADRARVADELGSAARSSGFLYCTGHGIPRELRSRLLGASKRFFARGHDAKMRYYIGNSTNHSGYVPAGEEVFAGATPDAKEAFDVPLDVPQEDPAAGSNAFLGPVQWPDDDNFVADVKAYYTEVAALARRIFAGFALAMGLPEDWFEPRLTRPAAQLRLIHYPYNADAPPDGPGIGAHTDYECFTILLPTAPGLEVLNDAGEWIDVPLVEDAFVVNIGDMMEAMTNGVFVATSHRVRRVKEERFSFPYFAACDYDTVIEPLPRFVTADRPAKFKPLVSGDHLLAQTAQTFTYMKRRVADGSLILPKGTLGLSSFGEEARHATA
jgi:isopenicillin N synthase-like dioxygenase